MSLFLPAVEMVLRHEGGLSDDVRDQGGITNYGISLRFAKTLGLIVDIDGDGDVDADDIRKLPREKAIDIYRAEWWERHRLYRINDQHVATKLLDLSVNMGQRQAVRLLQRACRAVGILSSWPVDDGLLGPATESAVNQSPARSLLPAFRSEAAGFYRQLADQDATQFQWALKGWLNRAYA